MSYFIAIPGYIGICQNKNTFSKKSYYISSKGNDANSGSLSKPWRTLEKINSITLNPGSIIYLEGGKTFTGTIMLDSFDHGNTFHPVLISSFGKKRAIIDGGEDDGILIQGSSHININNLVIKGSGRKNGNKGRGIHLVNARNIIINNIEAHNFLKAGVEVINSQNIKIEKVFAHDNGASGIAVNGLQYPKRDNRNIYIGFCRAENNPGDPFIRDNHSGNGIVVGLAYSVTIEYCTATNNGWDMPWKGNGPVGIWAWESDSVIIQHCISYRNRTAPGARDGGGFDLDGGITNSIVQYNLSYNNEGYGFGIFQFPGATPWHDNIFRYNISINDGNTVQDGASVVYWNGDDDSSKFRNCKIYNNLFINRHGPVLSYVDGKYRNSGFYFINNIFIAKDDLMAGGDIHNEFFYGNIWWSLQDKFKLNGYTNFRTWVDAIGKEKLNGKITGSNLDPKLMNAVNPTITDPRKLKTLTGYYLPNTSPLKNKGLDMRKEFGFFPGLYDFFGNRIPQGKNYEPGVHEVN